MSSYSGEQSYSLPFNDTPRLELDADAVAIQIRPVAAGEEPMLTLSGPGADDLIVEVSNENGAVRVRIHHRARAFMNIHHGNAVTARLTLPRGLTMRLQNQAGSIDARELGRCVVEAQTAAGQIRLRDMSGQFNLRSNAGQLRGDRLSGSFFARTDAGQIRLSITGLEPGEHSLSTSAGAIKVELAPGLNVRIETRTTMGSARSSYPSTPGAAAVLRATADIGAVSISPGDFSGDAAGDRAEAGPAGAGEPKVVKVVVKKAGATSSSTSSASSWSSESAGTPPPPPAPPAPPPPPSPGIWSNAGEQNGGARLDRDAEMERILKLVEDGQLSAREANDLLRALDGA